jgi:ABC-2 type transport system ATP-binding protein
MDTQDFSNIVIDVRDLAKAYGRKARMVVALDGVSFAVRRGEVFGLLGRNGAGKTTLVRTLLGLLRPQRGAVRLFGRDPSNLEVRRHVGFSPEEPGFPRYLYPREVLEYCGALSGLRGQALAQAVERELTRAELQPAANRQARHLSKGMKQRLSLAQAFLHRPELLILDEPTADLDPIGRRQVRDAIVEFREQGGTVLLNSHLLSEVERVCDRVAVIHGGRLLREGRVDELLGEGQELEDFFVELVRNAGGGTGYAPQWPQGYGPPEPPP